MSISANLVKDLRERTGAGMMECKKALVDSSGDIDAAVELLRTRGDWAIRFGSLDDDWVVFCRVDDTRCR